LDLRLAAASGIGGLRSDRGRHDGTDRQGEGKHRQKDERLHGLSFPYSAARQLSDIAFVPFSSPGKNDFVGAPMCFMLQATMKQSVAFAFGGTP
jgi:hypothetical protein